ncbi:hypothetical protein FF900_01140 [Bordetella pertussis]|nr:hypothetical protein C3D97_01135 [Bordetella pertussis]QKC31390.1 hypothetical protein FF900_01140 [Bordetella pertussis]QKC42331.1 hypothetical protein FF734_01140 [Bordetella pertussis]QKC57317.1 hypothetical protein CG030_01140 [Bordetella pertussis]
MKTFSASMRGSARRRAGMPAIESGSGGPARCEDSIGCMHGSSEPDLRNWKSPTSQFTQGARPDEHP